MSRSENRDFNLFFTEKLRPSLDRIKGRSRAVLVKSAVIALGVFLLMFFVTYMFFSPHKELLGDYSITYWPLMIMLPATLAVICFSIMYILLLRDMVDELRGELIGRLAEFIDPGFVHVAKSPLSAEELRAGGFLETLGEPVSGGDLFRGRVGDAAVELAELEIKGAEALHGMYMTARFPRNFKTPAALFFGGGEGGGTWEQFPPDVAAEIERYRRHRLDALILLSCEGDRFRLAVLEKRPPAEKTMKILEGFDFGNSRQFCLDAAWGLDIVEKIQGDESLWA